MKNLPAIQEMQKTWVQPLGQEYPLEEGIATQSSILAWRIPWTEEPGRLQSTSHKELGTMEGPEHACVHLCFVGKSTTSSR